LDINWEEKMGFSLKTKLVLFSLLISAGAIVLAGFLINYSLNRRFKAYLEENIEGENRRIVDILSSAYQSQGGWEGLRSLQMSMGMMAMMGGKVVRVEDSSGREIFDSGKFHQGMMGPSMMGQFPMHMGMMGRVKSQDDGRDLLQDETREYPLTEGSQPVGRVFITSWQRKGIWSPQDILFRRTIDFSILFSALIASSLALALSVVFSRGITRPLNRLGQAAKRLGEGDLSQRVSLSSQDELGVLGDTFNWMAQRLERLDHLRKKLATEIAHEIRTPLTTMRAYLESFKDGLLKPNKKNLTSLEEELQRLTYFADALQKTSAAQGMALRLKLRKRDLRELVKKVAEHDKPMFKKKDILVEKFLPSHPVMVKIDDNAVKTVIHNLLSNAYKYLPEKGKVTLTLALSSGKALLSVEDNGPGIPKEDLPFVFERFYRGKGNKMSSQGVGVGLSIAKELVEAQGGKINIESRLGKGTKLTILFPLAS
jgi:signal transduction histidine kinase